MTRDSRGKAEANSALLRAQQEAKRKRLLRIIGGILGLPVIIFLFLFIRIALLGSWRELPPEASTLTEVYGALRGDTTGLQITTRVELREDDPFYVDTPPELYMHADLPPVPPATRQAANEWVLTLNRLNPSSILYHEVDASGNLYLFPAGWFYDMDMNAIRGTTDALGSMWGAYLEEVFGVPEQARMEDMPGLLLFDCNGEVSRLMAGYVRVLRLPETCD